MQTRMVMVALALAVLLAGCAVRGIRAGNAQVGSVGFSASVDPLALAGQASATSEAGELVSLSVDVDGPGLLAAGIGWLTRQVPGLGTDTAAAPAGQP